MNNYRNSRDGLQSLLLLIAVVGVILIVLYKFIATATKKGKLVELAISSFILALALYGSHYIATNYTHDLIQLLACYITPLGIYAIYWSILLNLSPNKLSCEKTNLNWKSKDWWWSLDGWEFEEEVARIFRLNGYKTKVTKKTSDGGIDIVMYKGNCKYAVQCKHYQSEVSVDVLRALNGVKQDFGADVLILVASSGITKAGWDFVQNKPYIKILTLKDIMNMGLNPEVQEEQDEKAYNHEIEDNSADSIDPFNFIDKLPIIGNTEMIRKMNGILRNSI